MRTWEEIAATVIRRRREQSDIISDMAEVRDRYNGTFVVPLPDVEGEPALPPTAPALIAAAIDSTAQIAASTNPIIITPALTTTDGSRKKAKLRRTALEDAWKQSHMSLLRRRLFRHYAAYGTYSLLVMPDWETDRPRIEVRDPLTTYPEPRAIDDLRPPRNVAYVFGRSLDWILANFPAAERQVGNHQTVGDRLWDVVEWIDEDDIVLGVLGQRQPAHEYGSSSAFKQYPEDAGGFELARWPNRLSMVPAVAPRRITLDRVAGQVSQTVGLFDLMNRLMALDITAAEKAIFPDRYIIGQDGRAPQVVSGSWKDGRTGEANLLLDVQSIGELVSTQGPLVHPVIDRIERAIRISGGVMPFMTGETVGSLRTGRAMSELGSVAVDPRIQEMQEVMQISLTHINEIVLSMYKEYWPNKQYDVWSGSPNDPKITSFTPSTHFETTANEVRYPFIGLDASQLSVVLPQRVGSGMLSTYSAMVFDPFVSDPEAELARIQEEQLDRAIAQSVNQQSATGALPLTDLVRIKELVRQGEDIVDAVQTAQQEAQERQAQEAAPTDPAAQPGLAAPGQGVEAANPFPEPPQGLNRAAQMRQVLGAIRGRA